MADARGTPVTDDQLKSLAMMILMKAFIFADAIEIWNYELFKTWKDFQAFFILAQSNYKRARPTETAASLGSFSQVSQANVDSHDPSDALREAEAYIAKLEAAQSVAQVNDVASTPPPASPNDELLKQLLTQMEEIQAKVATKNPKKPKDKDKTSKERLHCWTHGSCTHKGTDCKHPKEGHKKEATFSAMMGGSTKDCY